MADEVSPDLILLDLRLPDMDGMDVLRALRSRHPEVAVIIITGFGQIQSAVEAIKVGATDYLEKPFEHLEKLKLAVSRALDAARAKREIRRLHGLQEKQYGVDQIIGDSEPTRTLRDLIRKVARSEAQTILIQGDSGTGKELVARGLHYESARRDFPFMEVNCAAITETLFESELFSQERAHGARRPGDAVPRRGERDVAQQPGEVPAGPSGAGVPACRRHARHQGGPARHHSDQPAARDPGQGRAVP